MPNRNEIPVPDKPTELAAEENLENEDLLSLSSKISENPALKEGLLQAFKDKKLPRSETKEILGKIVKMGTVLKYFNINVEADEVKNILTEGVLDDKIEEFLNGRESNNPVEDIDRLLLKIQDEFQSEIMPRLQRKYDQVEEIAGPYSEEGEILKNVIQSGSIFSEDVDHFKDNKRSVSQIHNFIDEVQLFKIKLSSILENSNMQALKSLENPIEEILQRVTQLESQLEDFNLKARSAEINQGIDLRNENGSPKNPAELYKSLE